jgi:hypothetical protein
MVKQDACLGHIFAASSWSENGRVPLGTIVTDANWERAKIPQIDKVQTVHVCMDGMPGAGEGYQLYYCDNVVDTVIEMLALEGEITAANQDSPLSHVWVDQDLLSLGEPKFKEKHISDFATISPWVNGHV